MDFWNWYDFCLFHAVQAFENSKAIGLQIISATKKKPFQESKRKAYRSNSILSAQNIFTLILNQMSQKLSDKSNDMPLPF